MRVFLIILAVVLLVTGLNSLFILYQTEQAIILQFGKIERVVRKPGLHVKVPFIQDVVKYDNRILDLNAKPSEVIDKEQKPLIVDAFVKYRITDPLKFYQSVQTEARAVQRLSTFLFTSLRQVLGELPLRTLLTGQRQDVMDKIQEDVVSKAQALGVKVVDVRIMRADFPKENSERIYERMKTEREQEARDFRASGEAKGQEIRALAEKERTILLAEADKRGQVVRGEGDAIATRTFAEAFSRDPSFYSFYRTLQAYRKAITKSDTSMVLSPDSEFLKLMNDIDAN